jgi:hypothetical protein
MPEQKTKATGASVRTYLAAIEDEVRRADCETLIKLMRKVTGEPPKMWGPTIVGFGSYHYRYDSGHEGDACLVGFSSRKPDISLYFMGAFAEREALLAKLGRHKAGKGCVYVRRLADIDLKVLETYARRAVADLRKRYPARAAKARRAAS